MSGKPKHDGATPHVKYVYRRADHDSSRDRALVTRILADYCAGERTGDDAAARYEWLYRANPHGPALTFLALDPDGGQAVGLTSLFPRRMMVAGAELTGAIGGDGYVVPAHRRRGIVTALHREAMTAMREGAVAFMFGPPEPNNLRALVQAGAKVTGAVQRFTRPLAAKGIGKASRFLGPSTRLVDKLLTPRAAKLRAVELGRRADPRVDRVFRDMLDERPRAVTPIRDAAFYAWRFAQSPAGVQRGYLLLDGAEPAALVALERSAGAAALLDVVAPSRRRRWAHAAALDLCRDDHVLHAQVHVPAPREVARLCAAGFVPRATKAFQVQVPPDHRMARALTRESAWQYMWADGDVDHVL